MLGSSELHRASGSPQNEEMTESSYLIRRFIVKTPSPEDFYCPLSLIPLHDGKAPWTSLSKSLVPETLQRRFSINALCFHCLSKEVPTCLLSAWDDSWVFRKVQVGTGERSTKTWNSGVGVGGGEGDGCQHAFFFSASVQLASGP